MALGDIVARAGRSLRLMVVDVDGEWITAARKAGSRVIETRHHVSGLVLLSAA